MNRDRSQCASGVATPAIRACLARLLALVAVCVAATGCAVDEVSESDNHSFGWTFEAQAANGLQLRNEPDVVEPVPIAVLADIYDQTQACTGISARGPFVIVVADMIDNPDHAGEQSLGLIYYDPPLILITQGYTWTGVAQHEFVHYLLDHDGFPRERNHAHDSPLFSECVHFCGLIGCT